MGGFAWDSGVSQDGGPWVLKLGRSQENGGLSPCCGGTIVMGPKVSACEMPAMQGRESTLARGLSPRCQALPAAHPVLLAQWAGPGRLSPPSPKLPSSWSEPAKVAHQTVPRSSKTSSFYRICVHFCDSGLLLGHRS